MQCGVCMVYTFDSTGARYALEFPTPASHVHAPIGPCNAAMCVGSQARAAEYRNERALAKRLFNFAHELNEHGGQPAS